MILTHIYDVDISQPLLPTILQPMMVTGDKLANRIGVRLKNGAQPYTPDGSCRGYVLRADGATVPILNGVVNGNEMYIDLPEAAYAVQGSVVISIVCVTSTAITTVFLGSGTVNRSQTDVVIDPGTVIDDISTLIQAIETAVASIPEDYSTLSSMVDALTHVDLSISGKYIASTGAETANSDYSCTDYIPVNSDSVLILDGFWTGTGAYAYMFYDSSKAKISGANSITTRTVVTTIPSTAAYVRFSSRISQGETPVAYVSNHVVENVAALKADSEMNNMAIRAAAAPNYAGLTFPVAKGDYCWYNGILRKANQDISTAESWTAAHWDTAVIGEDMGEIRGDVADLKTALMNHECDLASNLKEDEVELSWTGKTGTAIKYEDGTETSSTAYSCTDYVLVRPYNKIKYKRVSITTGTSTLGLAFYTKNKEFISGEKIKVSSSSAGYTLTEKDVPANAYYVRFTYYTASTYGSFEATGKPPIREDIVDIKSAIRESSAPYWGKGQMNYVAQQSFDDNGLFTTAILKNVESVTLTGCKASVFLYSGFNYLGKVVNASGAINQTSGVWYYYESSVPVAALLKTNSADGVRLNFIPTDDSTITLENMQTWAAEHVTITESVKNSADNTAAYLASIVSDYETLAFVKGSITATGTVYTSSNAVVSGYIPFSGIYKITASAGCTVRIGFYNGETFLGKIQKSGSIGTATNDFMDLSGEIPVQHLKNIVPTATHIRICMYAYDDTTITNDNANTWGRANIAIKAFSVGYPLNYYSPAFIKATLTAGGGVYFAGNGAITSDIMQMPRYLKILDGARANILLYRDNTYIGKVVNATYGINTTEGAWYSFYGDVDVTSMLTVNNANGIRVTLLPTDGTTVTNINASSWAASHMQISLNEERQRSGVMTYRIDQLFRQTGVHFSSLGNIPQTQAFCKYNGKIYAVSASKLRVINPETFVEENTYNFSFGHGNSISLGAGSTAYVSGCLNEDKNKVFVVDLSVPEITGTITLPFGDTVNGTDVCVDELAGLMYIFTWAESSFYTPRKTEFVVYDYINGTIVSRKTIPRLIQAPQACDYFEDRIILGYGYEPGSKAIPNGWLVFDTAGNIVGEFVLTPIGALEPQGVFIDRESHDILISTMDGYLYSIKSAQ